MAPSSGTHGLRRKPAHVEQHTARQRIPVGVETGRRQRDQRVPWHGSPPIDDARPVHGAHDEAGDVVFPVRVEARHLRGLAAKKRAPVLPAPARHARHHLFRDVRQQAAGRKVIEEEQGLGALHEDVVDAVVDQVGADRVVPAGHERDLELGADAVCARDEHRLAVAVRVEAEKPAERPDLRQHARRGRRPCERLDPTDRLVSRVDVDARLPVVHQKSSFPITL